MASRFSIGIMGFGMVGGALGRYLSKAGIPFAAYDPAKNMQTLEDINRQELIFVCVPTPYVEGTGFDLSLVRQAVAALHGGKIVVIKSTVLPGTTEKLQKEFPQHRFLFNPEFLTESTADQDMAYPDRQLIGYTEKSFTIAGDIMHLLPLAPFERVMPATAAETVKYFNNTWFATKVVFANQIYDLCRKLGVDYDAVRDAAAADKRIGRSHLDVLHKGYRGYGGKCLPKDTRALIQLGDDLGAPQDLLKLVESINSRLTGGTPPQA